MTTQHTPVWIARAFSCRGITPAMESVIGRRMGREPTNKARDHSGRDARDAAVTALLAARGPVTVEDVAAAIGGSRKAAVMYIARAIRRGLLRRSGKWVVLA